ncbi:MAG: hypothetical protein ACOY4Q_03915 [Bacillota bacterium]
MVHWRKPIVLALLTILFITVNWGIYNIYYKKIELAHMPLKPAEPPVYLGEIKLGGDKKPAWVYVYEEKVYVNYFNQEKVDILTPEGKKTKDFRAKITKGQGAPQGMFKSGSRLLVADFQNGGIGLYADNGRLLDAYYETAEKRQIKPVSAAVYENVFFITDVNINGWMAVLDDGEMIMEVKGDDEKKKLEFPYGIAVTDDGRVIITDPAGGKVKVFACAGWYAYDIAAAQVGLQNPQGVAIDGFGRIHIVDNGTGKIFVFDNSGKFMFTYGRDLKNPSTVAVDKKNRVIYITNTEKGSLSVWGY